MGPAKLFFQIALCLSFVLAVGARAETESAESVRVRERLNQLFYWRLADELKISTEQERAMAQTLSKIQSEREGAYRTRMDILRKLKDKASPLKGAELKKEMDRLPVVLKTLAELDVQEHVALRKILGDELLGRFYVIREETVEKIRGALKK